MNFFNLGRSNFFGIIIPGAFLLLNIVFLNQNLVSEFTSIKLSDNFFKNVDSLEISIEKKHQIHAMKYQYFNSREEVNQHLKSILSDSLYNKHQGILNNDDLLNSVSSTLSPIVGNNTILFSLLLILSYILGFSLRLIKPVFLEVLSFLFVIPKFLYTLVMRIIAERKKDEKMGFLKLFDNTRREFFHIFPYTEWFFNTYLKNMSKSYREFYEKKILLKEFGGNLHLLKGYNFINYCKLFVYNKSDILKSEILFHEGLVRFLSGMSISLIISLIFIQFSIARYGTLFLIYFTLFILFLYKLRHIRFKEVLIVFDCYYFTSEDIIKKGNENNGQ